MGKGKADGVGFLRKVVSLPSRSGRARNPPPRLLDDDSSQGGRGRGAPRGGGGGGRAPRGRGGGGRATTGGHGQKECTLTDLGVLSSRPSSSSVPSSEEEEEDMGDAGDGDLQPDQHAIEGVLD